MDSSTILMLAGLFFVAAFLYSSVGHAGASGYLAAMALFGIQDSIMKPTSLGLNILVATIASVQFLRAGCFSWSLYWPFGLGSIPIAYWASTWNISTTWYFPLVGLVLLCAAVGMLITAKLKSDSPTNRPPIIVGILIGIVIGLLSGLTSTGGGIFLSPIILFFGWASTRVSSGVSVVFILGNSIAGLIGRMSTGSKIPEEFPWWALAVLAGGIFGSYFGSKRFNVPTFRKLLALVLLIAAGKLIKKAFE